MGALDEAESVAMTLTQLSGYAKRLRYKAVLLRVVATIRTHIAAQSTRLADAEAGMRSLAEQLAGRGGTGGVNRQKNPQLFANTVGVLIERALAAARAATQEGRQS